MAWQTPKTNWKQGDKVNMQDYNRWKNNITYLRELSLEVYKSYTLTDMGTDKAYTDYIYADEINTIEANLAALPVHTYPFVIGEQQTYYPNQPTPDYKEFNRIESACLLIYNNLTGQIHGRRRLAIRLGGSKFLKTDWKDDIFEGEHRLYSITDAPDGKKYIEDVTPYTQQGDVLSALQMQQIGEEVNRIQSSKNVTFTAAGWTGTASPYIQTVAVAGITANDIPGQGVVYPTGCTRAQQMAINKAVGYIYDLETGDGTVTLRCTKKPTVDITLGLKGVV